MALLAFLNELSYPSGHRSHGEARECVRNLIGVLRGLKKERTDLALHSSVPLGDVPLGDNLWLSSLRADGQSVDEWRFLRGLENRAPFHIGLDREIDGLVDYEFEGMSAIGLGLAHNFDALAISFAEECWLEAGLIVTKVELLEDDQFEREQVEVRNASIQSHVDKWRDWLGATLLVEPLDGGDLWTNRVERFTRLQFLPHVEAQIRSLKSGSPELLAVNRRLWEIQEAVAAWNFTVDPLPTFRTKVTPEYEQRRNKFNFVAQDGQVRCFDMHARYTPGAGRIHMWLDRSKGTAIIGHVGEKVR